ncbi:F-box domain containing protein [Tanacetum coccineum]
MEENTIDTTDRISMLPESIVHHILSYLLDDAKSRVRMSVLSKEWFALTASVPFLYFHLNGAWYNLFLSECGEYIRDTFYKYVEYMVSRFCDQNISAHTLDICTSIINLEQRELVGRFLDLVLEKGLQVMNISFYYRENLTMCRLPNTLLSASSLTSLTLHECELPSSLTVGVVKFKSLKLLSLTNLPIEEGVIEYLTKSCPILEEIYLKSCYGFKTFCVKRHHNLLKVEIYCYKRLLLERIDVEAPNLSYFLLDSNKEKAPSMFMASCKKLTIFCYSGSPLKILNDFLSNFPLIEILCLDLPPHVNNLRLSNHSLRKIRLHSHCDLEKIDLNTPSLLLFELIEYDRANIRSLSKNYSYLSKGCMKCVTQYSLDILWFQKLRKFLEKNSIFKVLKLDIYSKLIDVEKLKLIQSPPYELEHVELYAFNSSELSSFHVAVVDVVLWCCRPRSLTLDLYYYMDTGHVVKLSEVLFSSLQYTYEKLLRQENEGQTNIKFVLFTSSKDKQYFSDLNSLLKRLSLNQGKMKRYLTFIKEEGMYPVMTEVQKVTSTSRELDLVFSFIEESGSKFIENPI